MRASYKKLWKLLIDRDMKKSDLAERANVSVATLTKLTKCENVNVDILIRICSALECEVGDIMELIGNDTE
jgi:DNA-binding Xre family transcriptional regulator